MSKNKNKNKAPAPKAPTPPKSTVPATPTMGEAAMAGSIETSTGEHKVINFYQKRWVFFTISLIFIACGIAAALINGIKLDISFQGGSIIEYTYDATNTTIDLTEAGKLATEALGQSASCQDQSSYATGDHFLVINVAGTDSISQDQQQAVNSALEKAYPNAKLTFYTSQSVEPFTGKRFFHEGLLAILISFGLILVYVGIRFQKIGGFSAGAMAIVALLHDAFIVTSVFFLFQIPLNDMFVAAVLTIIGFSINDTIVIYDRIRENKTLMGPKTPTEVLVDASITQCMSRSINTNISVFLSITIVFIFAQIYNIETIKDFALPMMFGTISGCYSTICIAGPLWTSYKNHQAKKALNA